MSDSLEQRIGEERQVTLRGHYVDLIVVHDSDPNVTNIFRNRLKVLRAPTSADQALFITVDHIDPKVCLEFQAVAANLTVTSIIIGYDEEPTFKLQGPFVFAWSEIKFIDEANELTVALVKHDLPQTQPVSDNT